MSTIGTDSLNYEIKRGDCPWKIAQRNLKDNKQDVTTDTIQEEMLRLAHVNGCDSIENFNKKFVTGNIIKVDSVFESSDTISNPIEKIDVPVKKEKWSNIQGFYDEINSLPDDKSKVLAWHKKYPTEENFVIVDKKECKAIVYSPEGEELTSFMVGLGREKGDDYLKSNNVRPMTSAGIYTIDAKGTGKDGYAKLYNDNIFTLTTDKGATGVALHQIPNGNKFRQNLNYDDNLENNRYSNGCVNFEEQDFEKLEEFLKVGAKVYILPEDENNYLMAKNGQLNLTQKKYTGEVMTSNAVKENKSIKIVSKATSNETSLKFSSVLEEKKTELLADLDLDNDTYNNIALLSLGIAEQESKMGESTKYKIKESCNWLVSALKWVKGLFTGKNSYNSRGLTQMKIESYTDPKTKELFKKYEITSENLDDPKKSALATMIVLGCMYKNELPGVANVINEKGISKMDALLYIWNGRKSELTKGTATPEKNNYINNVKTYAKNFDIEQKEQIEMLA